MTDTFYVYALLREPGRKPFYIGKGKGRRWMVHQWNALKGEDSYKARVIRKVIKKYGYLPKVKVRTGITEDQAFFSEKALIMALRHAGCKLVNQTDGGEGMAGWNPPPAFRERSRRNLKEIWSDPERRQKRTKAVSDAWADPETGKRMREATRVGHATAEFSEKMSEISIAAWADPNMRQRQRAGVTEAWARSEVRTKMVAGLKAAWIDPERRARRAQSMRDGWARRRARLAAAADQQPE